LRAYGGPLPPTFKEMPKMEIEIKFTPTEYTELQKYLCPNGEKLADIIKKMAITEGKNKKLYSELALQKK
jgi:hypothetical protein